MFASLFCLSECVNEHELGFVGGLAVSLVGAILLFLGATGAFASRLTTLRSPLATEQPKFSSFRSGFDPLPRRNGFSRVRTCPYEIEPYSSA